MKLIPTLLLAASLPWLAAGAAQAQALSAQPYALLQGQLVNFEDLPPAAPEGSLLEGLVSSGGVLFGERFAGQELSLRLAPRPGAIAQDWFDDLSFGTPLPGLQLLAGAAGANLGVYDYGDSDRQALAGIGPQHPDGSDPFGFGAISARFAAPVSALGLQIREAHGGQAWLALYREDGSLIERLTLNGLSDGLYAWGRSDGSADIAGFSLYNADAWYGIAIDNLLIGSVVPEPAQGWLLAAGLLAVSLQLKRRRQAS